MSAEPTQQQQVPLQQRRKVRRLGGAVILFTAGAFLAGYYLRGCGSAAKKTGKQSARQESAAENQTAAPEQRPKIVSVELRGDKLFHAGREIGWDRLNLLAREAYESQQQLELVVQSSTVTTAVVERAERDLSQYGVRYFKRYR